jgi:phosphate transport system protein
MRDAYHEELDEISRTLVEMTRLVRAAISRATNALLDADLELAESVITADEKVDAIHRGLDESALGLLARQQPVASDLRMIITSLRMSADLERMGDLARHVAKVARLRFPDSAVPAELRATVLRMGQEAEQVVTKVGSVIAAHDVEAAMQLERDDDEMDRLHRSLYQSLIGTDRSYSVETAVDVTLCGRYYERFADHAVSVAHRVVFLVTGDYPENQPRSVA